jgi:hypothetical protein
MPPEWQEIVVSSAMIVCAAAMAAVAGRKAKSGHEVGPGI